MSRMTRSQANGQVREAKYAYINDKRDTPGVDYAFELKATNNPEITLPDTFYDENGIKRVRKDQDGLSLRRQPKLADIADLGLLEVMGSLAIEDTNGYLLFDVYELRDGEIIINDNNLANYPQVREAFSRAKAAFLS